MITSGTRYPTGPDVVQTMSASEQDAEGLRAYVSNELDRVTRLLDAAERDVKQYQLMYSTLYTAKDILFDKSEAQEAQGAPATLGKIR